MVEIKRLEYREAVFAFYFLGEMIISVAAGIPGVNKINSLFSSGEEMDILPFFFFLKKRDRRGLLIDLSDFGDIEIKNLQPARNGAVFFIVLMKGGHDVFDRAAQKRTRID